MEQEKGCLGCILANKKQPTNIVYEDQYVTCFLDHDPFNEGHTLILPREHFFDVDELNKVTAIAIMNASILLSKAIKIVYKPDGITMTQNGGIFNDELTHYHMHVVPRYEHQPFADFYEGGPIELNEKVRDLSKSKERLIEAIRKVK